MTSVLRQYVHEKVFSRNSEKLLFFSKTENNYKRPSPYNDGKYIYFLFFYLIIHAEYSQIRELMMVEADFLCKVNNAFVIKLKV